MRFLNVIWDHLSWDVCPRSRLTGNWLHIYRQEKFSWKSRHDILLKVDTCHLMSTGFVPRVGVPLTRLYLCLSAAAFAALPLPNPRSEPPLTLGHLRSSTLLLPPVAGKTRAEGNPGFCMSPGKGLITDCHLLDPEIKLPGCSRPAGRRQPDPLPGVLRAVRKSPSPGALCQFHCRGFYHQNEMNSIPNISSHAVIKVEILGIFFLLIYIHPPGS